MTIKAGKNGALYAWNGAVTSMSGEACTINGNNAQITNTIKRLLSPNHSQAFTDSGGAVVVSINYLTGTATFNVAPTSVTCTGSYIPAANIVSVAQIYGWKLDIAVSLVDATMFGSQWKTNQAIFNDWKGTFDGYWYDPTWFNALTQIAVGGTPIQWWLLKLYIDYANTLYYEGFANVNGVGDSAPVNDLVKETITFTGYGPLVYLTS